MAEEYQGPAAILVAFDPPTSPARVVNGFDLSGSLLPVEEIVRGGPPRDGIPALVEPKFDRAREVDWLRPDDRLLSLERGGISKAYPIQILNWPELVNDRLGDQAILVTWCPLCGTGMAFDPVIDDSTAHLRRIGASLQFRCVDVRPPDGEPMVPDCASRGHRATSRKDAGTRASDPYDMG